MIDRLRGLFGKHNKNENLYGFPEGIKIGPEAQTLLKNSLDAQTLDQLFEIFLPLPAKYRASELMLQRIKKEGLLSLNMGFIFDPFTLMKNYIVPFGFSPHHRESGDCGDISKWFLYDLMDQNLLESLQQHHIKVALSCGNSPLFFSLPRARHTWVSFYNTKQEWMLHFDPAFGHIYESNEMPSYHLKENINPYVDVNAFFESSQPCIYGWTGRLMSNNLCPPLDHNESPNSLILGISQDESCCYGLGIESNTDRPFINLTYQSGSQRELYWYEHDTIAHMSSDDSGELAVTHPYIAEEVNDLLHAINEVTFTEVDDIDDPRLQGRIFV